MKNAAGPARFWPGSGGLDTLPGVLGSLVKRLVNGVVLILAGLTFFLMPIGKKTPAEHVVAIFTTRPAREAAQAFKGAAHRLYERIATEAQRLL